MATMKGVIIKAVGSPYEVVDDLEVPKPSDNQILVKSIATAINPVDTFMSSTGLLITAFPIVLGCDASGSVISAGSTASKAFHPGTRVSGCTRLGVPGHSTFQESFLMDAPLTLKIPDSLSFFQGATLGVGTYTASLGLFRGLGLSVPSSTTPAKKDEWILILGGASSVGQFSVQIAHASGYKVISTCSAKTADLVSSLGADATINYSKSADDQLSELKEVTGGKFARVWDAVAMNADFAKRALAEASSIAIEGKKFFATTDDWTEMAPMEGVEIYRAKLGLIGREDEGGVEVSKQIESYIPFLSGLLEEGKIKPNEVEVVEGKGFEGVAGAVGVQQKGVGGGKKVVIALQDDK